MRWRESQKKQDRIYVHGNESEAGGMLETQVERYCRWMILNTSGQPSKVTGKCTSTVHRRGEEETADRMKQVEMSVKVHLYSAKFVYTNKEFDTGTLYSQHMKCFKYAILNVQYI